MRMTNITVDEILADLDKMVGMTEVKKTVRELAENARADHERRMLDKQQAEERGEGYEPKDVEERNNIVLMGNPGTGKTTIVRTLAKLFKAIGLVSNDVPVKVTGDVLKAPYQGETPALVNGYCNQAMGGILFIDEAYTLANEQGPVDSFAREAITTLMTRMEDDGGKFISVIAGYENLINTFLDKSNPGMRSRFVHFINIPDYSAGELITIFEDFNVKPAGFSLTDNAREEAEKVIRNMVSSKGENFGNAREVRELFNRIKRRQSSRINRLSPEEKKEKLYLIEAEDIRGPEDKVLGVDEILAELDALTGMAEVKKTIREMAVTIRMEKEREEKARADALARGEKWEPKADKKEGHHIVLTGNPGTGKTTVAKKLAKLFKAIRVLPTDKFVHVKNATDLKGRYVGEAKDKVNECCRNASGGVLFIDEAYTLSTEQGPVDEGAREAVDTLLTHLENDAGKFICIVAGYEKQMGWFLDKLNPGMRSRFVHFIHIPDYNTKELFEIFENSFVRPDFTLAPEARDAAKEAINTLVRKKRGEDFGNAREMRTLFQEIKSRQSSRVSALPENERTLKVLTTIEAEDIGGAEKPLLVNEVLAELDAMVGMAKVKETVRDIANKIIHNKKILEQTGKAPDSEGNHICIMGNPGTGKTTIVRFISKLFKAIGLITNDKPVEIQGNDLKGSYVGQSKDQVNEYCRQARDGVLFIDEAYSLVNEAGVPIDEFAREAINQLMAHLENERDQFVCVVAGYPREMEAFIKKSNPGMARRFKHYITLPDYSAEELIEIFERFNVKKAGYTLKPQAQEKAREAIRAMVANKGPNFGNAGDVRTFFEAVTSRTASRVSALPEEQQNGALQIIEAEDIPSPAGPPSNAGTSASSAEMQSSLPAKALFEQYAQAKETVRYDPANTVPFFKAVEDALLFIQVTQANGGEESGTGFLISPEGYALTCNHVVEGANSIQARLRIKGRPGGSDSWHSCKVIKTVPGLDIALIQLEGSNFPSMKLAAEDREIKRGDSFALIGYPLGTASDYTSFLGTVASEDHHDDYGKRCFINGEAKSGNSGSPVISQRDGSVIGILLGSQINKGEVLTEEINYIRPIKYFWEQFTQQNNIRRNKDEQ